MNYRRFGRTGWNVSEIGFGCWGLGGGWGHQDDAEGQRALQRALELGVNFFDTAIVYGDGHSERVLGEVIRGWSKPVFTATKVPAKTMEWPARPATPAEIAFPADWIIRSAEKSLKNLRLERIDLLQMHVWTDSWMNAEGWRMAARELKKTGKIGAFGVSVNDNDPASVLELAASGEIDSIQVIYNIFEQAPADKLLPLCQKNDIAVIVRVPFDEGSLTGTFTASTKFDPQDWRRGYFKGERLAQTVARVEPLKKFLRPGIPNLSALALKFALSHPAVSTVIPGMRRIANVEANAAVSDGKPLSPDEVEGLKQHAWTRNFYAGAWDNP